MIKCKKVNGKNKCQVVSKSTGKPLSKPGLSKAAAQKRLRQVEYFKHAK